MLDKIWASKNLVFSLMFGVIVLFGISFWPNQAERDVAMYSTIRGGMALKAAPENPQKVKETLVFGVVALASIGWFHYHYRRLR